MCVCVFMRGIDRAYGQQTSWAYFYIWFSSGLWLFNVVSDPFRPLLPLAKTHPHETRKHKQVSVWWLRHHPKVQGLQFKAGTKRQDRVNARVRFVRGGGEGVGGRAGGLAPPPRSRAPLLPLFGRNSLHTAWCTILTLLID